MTQNRNHQERNRIRAARYAPPGGFDEALFMTLRHLPKRKVRTLKQKIAMASTIAAAIALFAIFAAPPIVRAASQLYTRLFGDVVQDIQTEQAKPNDQKLQEMIADYESAGAWHEVTGTSQMIGDVEISVVAVDVRPDDYWDKNSKKGTLFVTLSYSKIPSFDPNFVDFSVDVDGKRLKQTIDEHIQYYRNEKRNRAPSEEGWEGQWLDNGVLKSWMNFPLADWHWNELKQLTLHAEIDGQQLSIPFAFDPVKAHEKAVEQAKISVKLGEENFQHEKDELEAMRANAMPVGLSGSAFGKEYTVGEVSLANNKLYFTVSFGGIKQKNAKMIGMDYWLHVLSMDEYSVLLGGSDNDTFEDGTYTAVYHYDLGRDQNNLPDESLIAVQLELGSNKKTKDLAFRCNWKRGQVVLAESDAQMQDWLNQASGMREQREKAQPAQSFGVDLTPLNLSQTADGVTMRVTGVRYNIGSMDMTEFEFEVIGDVASSQFNWNILDVSASIDGYTMVGNQMGSGKDDTLASFGAFPPLDQTEFGVGERYVIEYPLYAKDADWETTNYPTPAKVLKFEFNVDRSTLPALED